MCVDVLWQSNTYQLIQTNIGEDEEKREMDFLLNMKKKKKRLTLFTLVSVAVDC